MLLSKPIVPFLDIHNNEQIITTFDIIISCRYLEKCHLRYKRLESISTKEGLRYDEWNFFCRKLHPRLNTKHRD